MDPSTKINKIYLVLFASISFAFCSAQYIDGYEYSFDSDVYQIYSDHISDGIFGKREAARAPLFYWIIAAFKSTGLSGDSAYFVYMFVCYFAFLVAFFRLTKNFIIAISLFALSLLSEPVFSLTGFFWTELGYSSLLLLSISFLFFYIKSKTRLNLFVFLICISLLPVQRYIGGYLSLYLGLLFLFSGGKNELVKNVCLLALATIPIVLLVLFNVLESGHISGLRGASSFTWQDNIGFTDRLIRKEFALEFNIYFFAIFLGIWGVFRKKMKYGFLLLILTPLVQVAAQIHSSSIYHFDQITPRFIIVLVPSLLFCSYAILQSFFPSTLMEKIGYIKYLIFSIALIVTLLPGGFLSKLNPQHLSAFDASIRQALSNSSRHKIIGVDSGYKHLNASKIVNGHWMPDDWCDQYKFSGNYRSEDFYFLPQCENDNSPIIKSVSHGDIKKPDRVIVLIDRRKAHQKWVEIPEGFEIMDQNEYYMIFDRVSLLH